MENERLQEIKSNLLQWRAHPDGPGFPSYSQVQELINALEAAEQRIATMTESYNSIGKINADQALELRELKMELRERAK